MVATDVASRGIGMIASHPLLPYPFPLLSVIPLSSLCIISALFSLMHDKCRAICSGLLRSSFSNRFSSDLQFQVHPLRPWWPLAELLHQGYRGL
jgi:hypothetical protein